MATTDNDQFYLNGNPDYGIQVDTDDIYIDGNPQVDIFTSEIGQAHGMSIATHASEGNSGRETTSTSIYCG